MLIAWVLVRYRFPGKKIIDGLADLPFALPTAIAGIALTTLYTENGWIGQFLSFKVAFTPLGITLALTFIGLPFVVGPYSLFYRTWKKKWRRPLKAWGQIGYRPL